MSEKEIVYYGAPTLAGLKTGNLMSIPYESKEKTMEEIRALNDELVPKGLCIYPLRFHKGRLRSSKPGEVFPHEIGLFLSYPPEDVKGFIEDPDGCKCVGTWKVYGDGEWMRLWEADAKGVGANLACDSVMANNAPDDEAVEACKGLGRALA